MEGTLKLIPSGLVAERKNPEAKTKIEVTVYGKFKNRGKNMINLILYLIKIVDKAKNEESQYKIITRRELQ